MKKLIKFLNCRYRMVLLYFKIKDHYNDIMFLYHFWKGEIVKQQHKLDQVISLTNQMEKHQNYMLMKSKKDLEAIEKQIENKHEYLKNWILNNKAQISKNAQFINRIKHRNV